MTDEVFVGGHSGNSPCCIQLLQWLWFHNPDITNNII